MLETGLVFGKLEVVQLHHRDEDRRRRAYYLCRCACGTEKVVHGASLTSGNTKSCGCLYAENAAAKRLPEDGGVINHLLRQYKRHATERGLPFRLTREEFSALVRLPCHYCGELAGNLAKTKNCREGFAHNGVDRKKPWLPYTVENCVPCCGACNIAKGTLTAAQFIRLAARVVRHQLGKRRDGLVGTNLGRGRLRPGRVGM